MKLLLDENISPSHAAYLRSLGLDAVAVLECGLSGAPDNKVLLEATKYDRALLTLDTDFGNLTRLSPEDTAGIILLRPFPPSEANIKRLLSAALQALSTIDMHNKLAVIEKDKIRIRSA
jgi:predicted nuclease of predicted toxin-antitoxin system